jgi:predicted nucleotidyltransferase component of viral defense system
MNETALKERLKTIAKEKGLTFNECWKQLLLERMLTRVSRSAHQGHLIFKGGFLLSYLIEIGRETTDLDFLLKKINAEAPAIQKMFEEM